MDLRDNLSFTNTKVHLLSIDCYLSRNSFNTFTKVNICFIIPFKYIYMRKHPLTCRRHLYLYTYTYLLKPQLYMASKHDKSNLIIITKPLLKDGRTCLINNNHVVQHNTVKSEHTECEISSDLLG